MCIALSLLGDIRSARLNAYGVTASETCPAVPTVDFPAAGDKARPNDTIRYAIFVLARC